VAIGHDCWAWLENLLLLIAHVVAPTLVESCGSAPDLGSHTGLGQPPTMAHVQLSPHALQSNADLALLVGIWQQTTLLVIDSVKLPLESGAAEALTG
jgi:hypothetical protein